MRSFSQFLVLLSLLLGAHSTYVVFRMDDAQDYWLTNAQTAVIDIFQQANVPLTVGIIGNYFGSDDVMVSAMKNYITTSKSSGWDFEVCNHGYNHEDFTTFTLAEQENLMKMGVQQIIGNLSGLITEITSFIPPFNSFNDDTVTALQNSGFDCFSSDISFYQSRPYPGSNPAMREWPAGAGSTDLSDTVRVSSATSFAAIEAQIAAAGFGLVMMHFVEFTDGNGNLNQSSLDDLQNLIRMCQDAGYIMTTMHEMNTLYYASSTSASSVPSTSTGSVASSSTGSVTSSSTGSVTSSSTGSTTTSATVSSLPSTTGSASQAASTSTTGVSVLTSTSGAGDSSSGLASTTSAMTTGSALANNDEPEGASSAGSIIASLMVIAIALMM